MKLIITLIVVAVLVILLTSAIWKNRRIGDSEVQYSDRGMQSLACVSVGRGRFVDLNTLIGPNPALQLVYAIGINDSKQSEGLELGDQVDRLTILRANSE